MARLERYTAQVPVDTDAGGMPNPRFTNALGSALESVGGAISSLTGQLQKRNEQRENTNAEIEWRKYQQSLGNSLLDRQQTMTADGAGFHDAFMGEVYRPAREKFLSTVPARLKPHYEKLLEAEGLDENDWATKAATVERDQMYTWARGEIGVTRDALSKAISVNPEAYDDLLAQGQSFIDGTPLPDAEKVMLRREWERMAQIAHLDRVLASGDATQILSDLGADVSALPPSAQFSVLSGIVEQIESGGDTTAVSGAGAAGRMQVMPGTAREIAEKIGDSGFRRNMTDDEVRRYLSDPVVGKRYGEFYLKEQLQTFGSRGGVRAALVAYNAGPAVAEKWIASGFDDKVLPKETRGYLAKFAALSPGLSGGGTQVGDPSSVSVQFTGKSRNRMLSDGRSTEDVQPDVLNRAKSAFAALGINQIKITSGYRDAMENMRVKGAAQSQHLHGAAIDIDVTGYSTAERVRIIGALSANGFGGMGVGSNIIHADLGARRAWGYGAGPHGGSAPPKWAESVVREHLAGRASIQSGAISGRYASLPYEDRQRYVAAAAKAAQDAYADTQRATAAQRYEMQQLVNNELALLEATGIASGNIDIATVSTVLGEDKLLRFLDDREIAQQTYMAKSGIGMMDDEAMSARLTDFQPDPKSPKFDAQQRVYTSLEKEVTRVQNERAKAPAKAAMAYPDVAEAYQAFRTEATPETAQAFVRATLQRQREFGVNPEALRPLPTAEASQIGRALARVPETRKVEDARAAIVVQYLALQEVFGDYTEEVITAALAEYKGVSKNTADLIIGYMQAIEAGQDPLRLRAKAETSADIDQTEGVGFFRGLADFFRGSASEDATGDGTAPLSAEERLRLYDALEDATPDDEAAIARMYGQRAVEAAKKHLEQK